MESNEPLVQSQAINENVTSNLNNVEMTSESLALNDKSFDTNQIKDLTSQVEINKNEVINLDSCSTKVDENVVSVVKSVNPVSETHDEDVNHGKEIEIDVNIHDESVLGDDQSLYDDVMGACISKVDPKGIFYFILF